MILSTLLLLATLLLAGVFLFSGALKWRDPEGSAAALRGFGAVPENLVGPAVRALPVVEVVMAVLLLASWGWVLGVVAALALVLLLAFTVFVARALASDEEVACHCFGAASAEPVTRTTLIRNLVLTGLGVAVTAGALTGAFDGFFPTVTSWDQRAAILLAAAMLAAVLAGLLAVRVGMLHGEVKRTAEEGERAVAEAQANAKPAEAKEIPPMSVISRDGRVHSLFDLASHRAKLVISVSPTCGACKNLQTSFGYWRQALESELDVMVLSRSSLESAIEHYGDEGEWLYADPDGLAAQALGVGGTPGAVLLGTNGKIAAGPALGQENILELIAVIIQAIGVNVMTGMAHQSQEQRNFGGEVQGEEYLPAAGTEIEDIEVLDEQGNTTTLHQALGALSTEALPVVSWRDSCPYCTEVAEELKQFSERGEVVLLINEPIETVRAQGLTGPVLQAVGGDASATLKLPGTPAGYPIGEGTVQPGGGVGGGSVLKLLLERAREKGTYVETETLAAMERAHAHAMGEHG